MWPGYIQALQLTCTKKTTANPPVAAQATAAVMSVVLGLILRGNIYAKAMVT